MESGHIPDTDISASSSYARSVGPEHARYLQLKTEKQIFLNKRKRNFYLFFFKNDLEFALKKAEELGVHVRLFSTMFVNG